MGLAEWFGGLSTVQKAGVIGGAGVAGLYGISRMGGGSVSAEVGEDGSNLNILDVRRPTDDINAVGGRDPNAWLLREIFRDLRKDQGLPTTGGTTPPPTSRPPAGEKRYNPVKIRRGRAIVDGVEYHSGKGANDNFIVNRRGKVLVRGVIGDTAWFKLRSRLGLGQPAPRDTDPRDPKARIQVTAPLLEPAPNGGVAPPQKQGPMRGRGN